ncbi:axin-1 isoform X1 [Diorhabda carinulata]|uniref:axin-1 isoform X1 n=1 Tax=Diorhabda carinulata TaxID=1163345 RepID=UPI0025A29C88|nr:axin-1 isoform X1 [Diorhabda carinulata]XP_057665599.1 axin-1 isoform X1 [Diorhabda carinulata]
MSERNERSKYLGKSKQQQQQQQRLHEASFDHKAPRPPVPGEERSHFMSDWDPSPSQVDWIKHKSSSPPPRKFYNYANESPPAPCGYEPDGSCRSNSRSSSKNGTSSDNSPPPACLKWANSLQSLLQDPDGVRLFHIYLESEGQHHADALDFWFACEGLRKHTAREKIQQLVKVIYKKFFVKSALPLDDELRKEIGKNIKSSQCLEPPVTLFDKAQAIVKQSIDKTTYPNFLKSDMYLQYLENVQNLSSSSSDFGNDYSNLANGPDPLPTLHEDMELIMNPPVHLSHASGTASVSTGYHTPNVNIGAPQVRLTKDLLLISQNRRAVDSRTKSETFASMIMYRGLNGSGAHAAYNSYNPVSRQDSELHSLSSHSDARTESDNMSMTDSSVDGRSNKRKEVLEARKIRELAARNKETHMQQVFIPRTQRVDTKQCRAMDINTFAAILIEKLTPIKRDQDQQELLEKKLKENESNSKSDIQSAIRELELGDDNDPEDILDQHLSRVLSDRNSCRSPGLCSPRQFSPPRNRHVQNSYPRSRRKEKEGSLYSIDSGNVHDFADGSEHKMTMVKSKSMPEYAEERFVRAPSGRRLPKKPQSEFADSGVSVVSDAAPMPVKENRVLNWLLESDKSGRGQSHTHSEMSLKHRSHRTSSATSPSAGRRRKGFGSRSSSLERSSGNANLVPAQPFIADPNMPPLPSPNTAIQLEEARRRLLEDDIRNRPKQRSPASRYYSEISHSSQSTLKKSIRGPRQVNVGVSDDVTTVVFTFCEEQFPYRTKIPGTQITLRQFKEYLPKKGNYRYFFKTLCEELGNTVIQEEVSNDAEVLPLWEGKIMAQVKPID